MFYLCLPESNKDLSDVPTGYLKHYKRAITHTRTLWRYQVTEDVNNVFALTDRNLKRRFSYWEISRIPREKGKRQIRGHVTSDSKSRWTFSRSKNWFPWQHTDPCNETGRLSFREVLDDNLNKWHFSEQKVSAFTFLALCNKAKRGGGSCGEPADKELVSSFRSTRQLFMWANSLVRMSSAAELHYFPLFERGVGPVDSLWYDKILWWASITRLEEQNTVETWPEVCRQLCPHTFMYCCSRPAWARDTWQSSHPGLCLHLNKRCGQRSQVSCGFSEVC